MTVVLSTGCGIAPLPAPDQAVAVPPTAAMPPPPPTKPAGPPALDPPDRSWPVEEYREFGIPSPDVKWSPADSIKAADGIANLCSEGNIQRLPRLKSPKSGVLFAKLSTTEDLNGLDDERRPMAERIEELDSLWKPWLIIWKTYYKAYNVGLVEEIEGIEIFKKFFRMTVVMHKLVDKSVLATERSDPLYEHQVNLRWRVRYKMADFLYLMLTELPQFTKSTDETIGKFIDQVIEFGPEFLPWVPREGRNEVIRTLDRMVKGKKRVPLHPKLKELRKVIEKTKDGVDGPREA